MNPVTRCGSFHLITAPGTNSVQGVKKISGCRFFPVKFPVWQNHSRLFRQRFAILRRFLRRSGSAEILRSFSHVRVCTRQHSDLIVVLNSSCSHRFNFSAFKCSNVKAIKRFRVQTYRRLPYGHNFFFFQTAFFILLAAAAWAGIIAADFPRLTPYDRRISRPVFQ